MKLSELQAREAAAHVGVYARSPIAFERGAGVHLYDSEGREYLDLLAGIAVCSVGHCHPKVTEAIAKQAAKLDHVSNLYLTTPQVDLAERLSDSVGGGKVFFANSGAEANEAALKLARRASVAKHGEARPKVVAVDGGFHGRTFATLAATGQPAKHEPFAPLPEWFTHVTLNDADALSEAIDEQTGAVILEIIQGEGGVRSANQSFLATARKRCDEVGASLIVDEVQTGVGRTGTFWAYESTPIMPDIVTVAKALGGGLPIGACIALGKFADVFALGDHATTFGGGPIVCEAALATLDVIADEHLLAHVSETGPWLLEQVCKLDSPVVTDIRGQGFLVGVVLSVPEAAAVADRMRGQGVIVGTAGPDVVRFAPPLIATQDHLQQGIEALATALEPLG